MKKVTRLMSAIISAALLASVVTVAPFSVGATETDQDVSVAYSEESAEAIPELSSEQATEPPIEETTVESHIIETTVAQTVEETSAVPKTQNSPKSIESVGASAGESVSANGIENKINTLSQAFANAEITHFTNNGEAAGSEESNCYLPNINDSLSRAGLPTGAEAVSQGASAGYSCYGFASYVFWYLYGSNFRYAPTASTPSYGDLLEFNGAHYAIYLGERNGNYYVYDSNWDYQCSINMHEIPKTWKTPVTIYHASNYAQVFDSEPPKTGGHVDFQRGTTMQGATPINTFVLKYTASDNIGVSRVYAHVWEFGQTEDQARTYEGALSGQNVTVTIPQSEMPESTYSIECYAEDATGNRASIGVKRTYFPIYKVIEDTGTYQVTADTAPVRHSPYEKINGKSTDCGQYHKGLKVSITGYYINSYGNKWYQLDNSNWIYSGNIKKCFQWSDVWNAINPFVGKNEKFYYFSDQAIMAGETISSKSGASVGAGVDEDSAVGVQNYIRVTGTSPEYYSVNGGNTTYYTITFDANGGSLSTTSKTVVGGSSMGYSPIPYRLGYQFDGWFTAAENGVQYTSDTVVNGNITLYAHWTRIVLLEGYCGDNLYFILYADGGLEFTGYGDMTSHPWTNKYSKRVYEVSMPQEVTSICVEAFDGCIYLLPFDLPEITTIPRYAFRHCEALYSFSIPKTVKTIDRQAFGYCSSLNNIEIPKSLESCSVEYYNLDYTGYDGPFYKCSSLKNITFESGITIIAPNLFAGCDGLESLVIPDTVSEIGQKAFGFSSLKTIVLPDGITHINRFAFRSCTELRDVILPKEVTTIDRQAFGYCTSLTTVQIPKSLLSCSVEYNNLDYTGYDGPFYKCSSLKTASFEKGTTTIAPNVFSGCDGLESIVLPDSVTTIEQKAFGFTGLKEVDLPDSITRISRFAFRSCENLKKVDFSNSITFLDRQAFGYCTSLTTVHIPRSLESCSVEYNSLDYTGYDGPFYKCSSLKKALFEEGTTTIAPNVFAGCDGLENVTIPNSVTKIGQKAFGFSGLLEITIPNTVTDIDRFAFRSCTRLTNVSLSKALSKIGRQAFGYCDVLTTIVIPKNVLTCETEYSGAYDGPFYKALVKHASFEVGMTKIPDNIFAGCTGLASIEIPDSVKTIGSKAFSYSGLVNISLSDNIKQIGNEAFYSCTELEKVQLTNSVSIINEKVFGRCSSLKNIVIPNSITDIGSNAFSNCEALNNIEWSNNLKNISSGAFANCTSLSNILFPNSVDTIGANAFEGCILLEKIQLPERINKINSSTFKGCSKLKEVEFPKSLSSLGYSSFENCLSLKRIVIPSSLKTMGSNAFHNCEMLETILISDYSIKEIPDSAFMDCPSIQSIVLPKGLTKISNLAFANNTSLTEVEIPESVTTIATNAFSYPDIMTAYGYTESYAKQYCDEKGINFVDNHVLSQGIALDQTPCASEDYIIMDLGETNELKFDVYPLNSNDVISLTSDNTRVTINGMHITSKSAGDSVITATATSGVEYTFTIHNRSVKNVSIKTLPENLKITQGNELDLTGFELQVNYNDNSNAVTDNYTISGFDRDTIGVQTVTVSYVGTNGSTYKTTFNVEVVDPRGNLTGISIKQYPRKLKYVKYDALDLSGLIVVENYDSGLEIEITDYKVTGYNALKLGKQTIKITKGEYTVTFEVEVTEKPVYAIGDTNLDGIVSIRDVTAIQRHIAELELFSDEQLALADTNGDGEINISDATHLQMYLAEYDVVLGKQ